MQALYFTALVHQYRRDDVATADCATRLLAVAEESEFRYWILLGQLLRGWCRERAGEAGGIAEIQAAIAGLERMGTVIGQPYFLVQLAELQLARRDLAAARAALDRAAAVSAETGELVWDAERHRVLGDVLLAEAGKAVGARAATRLRSEAAAAYARAHAVAVRQGASALALRALLSTHALGQGGAAGVRTATRIATLLARIEGDRTAPDLAAASRIAKARRNSAGTRSSRRNAR